MMRPSGRLERFIGNPQYQLSNKHTKKKKSVPYHYRCGSRKSSCSNWQSCPWREHATQMLLPLHFNFCRTTLKNEASGNEASRSVFLALRMVTIDPRSTWIGLRPSRVKNTGYSGSLASISMVDPSATIIDRLLRSGDH